MERFCEGLPFSHKRVLTQDEIDFLGQRVEKYAKRKRREFVYVAASLIVCPVALAPTFDYPALGFLPAIPVIALAWTMLRAKDAASEHKLAKAAASEAEVEVFGSESVPVHGDDETFLDDDELYEMGPQSVERLPKSLVVLTIDGHRLEQPLRIGASEVASRGSAPTSTFPARIFATLSDSSRLTTRRLSAEELDELTEHARLKRLKVRWWEIPLLLYMTFGAVVLTLKNEREVMDWVRLLVFCFVILIFLTTYMKTYQMRKRLKQDLADGFVVVREQPFLAEALPNSHILWSEEGKPGPWRNMSSSDLET